VNELRLSARAAIECGGSSGSGLDARPICVVLSDRRVVGESLVAERSSDVACRLRSDEALELAASLLELVHKARRLAS
jgi:hypothetical protein